MLKSIVTINCYNKKISQWTTIFDKIYTMSVRKQSCCLALHDLFRKKRFENCEPTNEC